MHDTPVVLYVGGDARSVQQAWDPTNDAFALETVETTALADRERPVATDSEHRGESPDEGESENEGADSDGAATAGEDERADSDDPDDADRATTAVAETLADGRIDAVVCRGDGTYDVRAVVEQVRGDAASLPVVVFDSAGAFSAAAATELDVAQYLQVDDPDPVEHLAGVASLVERHRAQQRERTMLASLLEHVPLSVYFKDREGRHVRVSDEMPKLTEPGYIETPDGKRHHVPADVHGKTDFDLYRNEFAEQTTEDDRRVIEDGESIEDRVEHSQGDELTGTYVATSKAPWYDESGDVVGLVGVTRDISERKQYEKQLERQNDRLERFTSVISHDLRNPLEVAMGRLEFALESIDEGDESRDHLESVERSLDRIDALVDDVLTLAREGETVSDPVRVSLGDVAREAWEVVDTAEATLDVETDAELLAAPGRLQQLFENLFRNAVEHGGPDVTVRVGDMTDDTGFFVADDGPGIDPENRDQVFEHGYTTGDDGTGLGLSIVRSIAEAHGWDVAVTESDEGGARFEVELFGTAGDF